MRNYQITGTCQSNNVDPMSDVDLVLQTFENLPSSEEMKARAYPSLLLCRDHRPQTLQQFIQSLNIVRQIRPWNRDLTFVPERSLHSSETWRIEFALTRLSCLNTTEKNHTLKVTHAVKPQLPKPPYKTSR